MIAALLGLAALVGTAVSLLNVVYPIKKLGYSSRRYAAKVAGLCFLVFVLVVVADSPDAEEARPQASPVRTPSASPEVVEQVREPNRPEPVPSTGVVSDRFALRWELDGIDLLLAIDTDLPDSAELSVSVRRLYFEVGRDEAYNRDYFQAFEPVSRWRQPRRISLDADAWRADLLAHQAEMASISSDMAFEIERIAEHVDVLAVLHANQPDPRFGGRGNPNLSGDAISRSGSSTIVEAEASVPFPLDGPPPPRRSLRASWDGLIAGESYQLSSETPLMPDRDASGDLSFLERMLYLPSGSVVRVLTVDYQDSEPWYEVVFVGDEDIVGWINGIALMRQEIERVSQ